MANRRRISDREWIEWVDSVPQPELSPYRRDDVWMHDSPEEGTCLFAARDRRKVELVSLRRGDGIEARLSVMLDARAMRGLAAYLIRCADAADPDGVSPLPLTSEELDEGAENL